VEEHLTAHLELYLSVVALAVALVVPLALELGTNAQELAGAALAACVLQGWLHWLLRRRAARVRRELIAEVRGLLRDRINNHLQVVMFSLAGSRDSAAAAPDRVLLALAMDAVAAVSRTLDELSTDSLRRWRERYADALNVPASVAGIGVGSERGGSGAGR
jgi:hypothetical protein